MRGFFSVAAGLVLAGYAFVPGLRAAGDDVLIGERPTIEVHLDQARIEAGDTSL